MEYSRRVLRKRFGPAGASGRPLGAASGRPLDVASRPFLTVVLFLSAAALFAALCPAPGIAAQEAPALSAPVQPATPAATQPVPGIPDTTRETSPGTAALSTSPAPAELSVPAPMAWLISGDRATIYIVGTIHYGRGDFAPFPRATLDALASADVILAELSTEDNNRAAAESVGLVQGALLPDNGTIADRLSPEGRETAIDVLGEKTFSLLCRFQPWVLSLALTETIYQRTGLSPAYSVDIQIYTLAGGRPVTGLDILEDQIALISGGTFDEQLADLELTLVRVADGSAEREIIDLADAYAAGDSELLARVLAGSLEEEISIDPGSIDDYRRMFNDRNRIWARKLAAYMEEGGSYFLFAGAGHFVGEGNVFDELRALGVLR